MRLLILLRGSLYTHLHWPSRCLVIGGPKSGAAELDRTISTYFCRLGTAFFFEFQTGLWFLPFLPCPVRDTCPSDTCLRRGLVLVLLYWMGGARSVYRLGQVVANQRVFLQACECLSSFLKHWLALVFCVVFTDTSLPAPPSG